MMRRCVFLFPGQGSQFPGMGRDLYLKFSTVRRTLDEVSDSVGHDVAEMMFFGDAGTLTKPDTVHLTMYSLSLALMDHLFENGVRPWAVAGHSLGEYGALTAAGCVSRQEGLRLVRLRGEAISRACLASLGTMAAVVGLGPEHVEFLCKEAGRVGRVVVANRNSSLQTVISGEVAAVEYVSKKAVEEGAVRVMPLNVGGAFHSPLMESAERKFSSCIDAIEIGEPQTILVSSVTGRVVEGTGAYLKALRRQITRPVLWLDVIRTLVTLGAEAFVEVGPGGVLRSLARQIDHTIPVWRAGDARALERLIQEMAL